MTALKAAAERATALPSYALPFGSRMLAVEKAAKQVSGHGASSSRVGEPWEVVAQRIDWQQLGNARRRDIRTAVDAIWGDVARAEHAAQLVGFGSGLELKSVDRAMIGAYLRHFPSSHAAFASLAAGAARAAARHQWPWQARHTLWNPLEGPQAVGATLLEADDPRAALSAAGLEGELAEGAFAAAAVEAACLRVATMRGMQAEAGGRALVELFGTFGGKASEAMLAYALLAPWANAQPSDGFRKDMGPFLVQRIGDPRINVPAWTRIVGDWTERGLVVDAESIVGSLRRWLTERAMRAFFDIVRSTVSDRVQWAAREKFWLAYLDANQVQGAWFAFGPRAEQRAGAIAKRDAGDFARISGGGDAGRSSLLMTIGDLRIIEWSDNGACRFWPVDHKFTPQLYRRSYAEDHLRAMQGPPEFVRKSHSGPWQQTFAGIIFRATRIRHPVCGSGR